VEEDETETGAGGGVGIGEALFWEEEAEWGAAGIPLLPPLLLPHKPVAVGNCRGVVRRQRTWPSAFRAVVYSSIRARLSAVPRRGPWSAVVRHSPPWPARYVSVVNSSWTPRVQAGSAMSDNRLELKRRLTESRHKDSEATFIWRTFYGGSPKIILIRMAVKKKKNYFSG
jgi:hypothetical protein